MRLFIGLPVTPAFEEFAAGVKRDFTPTGADFKWSTAGNLHVTLHFLGEVPAERLDALKTLVTETAAGFDAFTLRSDRLGVFASLDNPRVLWLGFGEGADQVEAIAAALKERLRGRYHVEEKPFKAHLTLARILTKAKWTEARLKLFERTRPGAVEHLELPVDRVVLYLSEPDPQGSRYSVLLEAPLRAPRAA